MVVSTDGAFQPISYGHNSHAHFFDTTTQAISLADTAIAVTWNTTDIARNISIDGTDTSKIVFAKGGVYHITFGAEIHSSSASTITYRFWPRKNGSDIANSAMVTSLHANGQTKISFRNGIFDVDAGDYLQAMFAADGTTGSLTATAATSYAPASPSVTMSIIELYVP
jgi:hypothetical protein